MTKSKLLNKSYFNTENYSFSMNFLFDDKDNTLQIIQI